MMPSSRFAPRRAAFAVLAAFLLQAPAALAQPLPSPVEPSRSFERRPLPEFQREPAAPGLVLPPAPAPGGGAALSSGARVKVTRFRIVGNTAYSEDMLRGLIAGYEGREVGNEELEEARAQLTQHYIANGYINSGALIPDQQVLDGVVTLRIIEGRLTGIAVAGENGFRREFVADRLHPDPGELLNMATLQERMQVLLLNPQVERINAEIGPGVRPGEAVLNVDLKEAPSRELGFALANNRSPSIGALRHELRGALRNLLGRGDELTLRGDSTEGLDDYAVMFSVPVSARDAVLWVRAEKSDSVVLESPFDILSIEARTTAVELGIRQPFYRTPSRELTLGAALSRRHTETFLLGSSFPFSPGLADGKNTVAALRLSADFLDRTPERVSAARLGLNLGLAAFGSTVLQGFPDSRFVSLLAQLQLVQRLAQGAGQLLLRFDLQAANDSLPASEKFSLGGAESVRGYRENRLVRDTGWAGSIEYRHRIAQLALGSSENSPEQGAISVAPFVDAGRARDRNGVSPGPRALSSVGLGLRWDVAPGVLMAIYRGVPLHKLEGRRNDLQDRGVHFKFTVQHAF